MSTYQSTNSVPEHEAFDDDVDEAGPHVIHTEATGMDHGNDTRYITWPDPICGDDHRIKVPWHLGASFTHSYSQCDITGKTLDNTVIKVRPPHGYYDKWHQGHAYPGTHYPDANGPTVTSFDINDAYDNGNPTGDATCPPGCVRDHTANHDETFHSGPVWSSPGRPDSGLPSKFYFRTQQHYDAHHREQYGWLNLEVFDKEFGEWHEMAFNMTEVQQLVDILQNHLTGDARLQEPGEESADE